MESILAKHKQPSKDQIQGWKKQYGDDNVYCAEIASGVYAAYPIHFATPDKYTILVWLDASGDTYKRQNILWQNAVLQPELREELVKDNSTESQQVIVSVVAAISEVVNTILQGADPIITLKDTAHVLQVNEQEIILQVPDRQTFAKYTDLLRYVGSKAASDYLLKSYYQTYSSILKQDIVYFALLRALLSFKPQATYSLKKA